MEGPESTNSSRAHRLEEFGHDKCVDRETNERLAMGQKLIIGARYINYQPLSDMTIQNGHQAERTLHGHKVILYKYSLWFVAAFTGQIRGESCQRYHIPQG